MKTLLILLLIVSTIFCIGQTDTIVPPQKNLGVNIGLMPSFILDDFNYYANFTIEKGKHFFAIGPLIGLRLEMNRHSTSSPVAGQYWLNGINLIYQKNPNTKGKRFDFYFQNEFLLFYYTDRGIDKYVNVPNQNYSITKSYKSHRIFVEDCIGYGFKVKFLKNFYINQSIGLGVSYSSLVIDYGDPLYNIIRDYFDPGLILKMGIGYTFKNKSKPVSDIDNIFFQK